VTKPFASNSASSASVRPAMPPRVRELPSAAPRAAAALLTSVCAARGRACSGLILPKLVVSRVARVPQG
jgi:hypothetical protein